MTDERMSTPIPDDMPLDQAVPPDREVELYGWTEVSNWMQINRPDVVAEEFVIAANSDDELVRKLVHRLTVYGVTDNLLADADRALKDVRMVARPSLDPQHRKFKWDITTDKNSIADPNLIWYLMLTWLINAGIADRFKRCASRECRKYHVRRGKWCSDTCGSRERLRDKRKRDKERQML